MDNIRYKYFACLDTFEYHEHNEEETDNSFVNYVAWYDYTYSTYYTTTDGSHTWAAPRSSYGLRPIWRFTKGNVYCQSESKEDGHIWIRDNNGMSIDITEYGLQDKFKEITIPFTSELIEIIDSLEKKGFYITISPFTCIIDENNGIDNMCYSVHICNTKAQPTWKHAGNCVSTDILVGLRIAMKDYMKRSNKIEALKYCVKGNYSYYVQGLKSNTRQ